MFDVPSKSSFLVFVCSEVEVVDPMVHRCFNWTVHHPGRPLGNAAGCHASFLVNIPRAHKTILSSTYLCMYVCMFVFQLVGVYVFTYVRTYVRTYVCMYVCMDGCNVV